MCVDILDHSVTDRRTDRQTEWHLAIARSNIDAG